jgi:uncharacterized protein DUF6855
MPETGLDDEAERANRDDGLVTDGELDLTPLLDASSDAAQLPVRYRVARPRIWVAQEPRREPVGFDGETLWQRGQELVSRRPGRGAKAEPMRDLRLPDKKQAQRLIDRQAGQMRLKSVEELDPAARSPGRDNRNAGLAERLDVAENRPLGDLERLGELARRQPATALQHEQHVEHPRGTHFDSLEKDDSRCQVMVVRVASMTTDDVVGTGTPSDPWQLTTPPGNSEFEAFRDPDSKPPALVVQVGKTQLRYQLSCIEDLHTMLVEHGDWMPLGNADEQKDAAPGTVEAWGRSTTNPVGGWYGIKKGLRGRFGNYIPPVLEALGLAEVEHNPRNNRMRAI